MFRNEKVNRKLQKNAEIITVRQEDSDQILYYVKLTNNMNIVSETAKFTATELVKKFKGHYTYFDDTSKALFDRLKSTQVSNSAPSTPTAPPPIPANNRSSSYSSPGLQFSPVATDATTDIPHRKKSLAYRG